MRLLGRRIALACALALAACSATHENPFADVFRVREPPPGCQLLFASNLYATSARAPAELYCIDLAGGAPARLTFCSAGQTPCAIVEAAPSPTRARLAVRRVSSDTNDDGFLTEADAAGLAFLDLGRGVLSELVPSSARVSGVDWSPTYDLLVYAAAGTGGQEDLFRRGVTREDTTEVNLTSSGDLAERRPRLDRSGSLAIYERIDADGKGTIWLFASATEQSQLSQGAAGTERLSGSPHVVGSDADPSISPDNQFVAFRRLTAVGDGSGEWDILTVDGSVTAEPDSIVSGPAYRGAPDWGSGGIAFVEADPASGARALVVVDGDGAGRRVLLRVGPGVQLSHPRWLAPAS